MRHTAANSKAHGQANTHNNKIIFQSLAGNKKYQTKTLQIEQLVPTAENFSIKPCIFGFCSLKL